MYHFTKILRVSVFLSALLAIPSFAFALGTTPPSICQVQAHLQRGSAGAAVTALQQALGSLGYFKVSATGYFGSITTDAVKQFQSDSSIDAVGEVGPLTHAALNAKLCAGANAVSLDETTDALHTQTTSRNQSALSASVAEAVRAATGSVAVAQPQHTLLPAYFNPGPLWDQIAATLPSVGGYAVLDITGTGAGNAPNSDYVAAVEKAQRAGVKVIGYVATSYGSRAKSAIERDIDNYKAWYHVDGIFFDQTSTRASQLPFYQDLANYVRASSGSYVVLNPGAVPDQGYMNVGDTVNIFEDTYNHYLSWQLPSWVSSYPSSKISQLIYAVPDAASMEKALTLSQSRNAGFIYITDDKGNNPWSGFPSYWSDELSALGGSSAYVYKFSLGDRVQTANRLSVRAEPVSGSTRLGVQQSGVLGTVVGGPQSDKRYTWWQINYDNGADGWSAENWLDKVSSPVVSVPTVTLSANPVSVTSGQSAKLSWSATNATSCVGTGFTANGTQGSVTVSPSTSTTYSMTCTGVGGSASDAVTVSVSAAASVPTVTLSANPVSVTSGQSAKLSWSSTNATSCTSADFLTGGVSAGTHTVSPTQSTTYSVTCTGVGGSASDAVTVAVSAPLDTSAPTVPTGLTAKTVSTTQVNLSWNASTDDIGVSGYRVYRNGALLTTVTSASYQDSGLSANTTYSYSVAAYDARGNTSSQTSGVSATTLAGTVSGWWKPGPTALAWQWTIDHPLNLNSATDMGIGQSTYLGTPAAVPEVYDIDGFDNPASTVAALHAMGKKVVCYIEVGSAENYRSDYNTFPASVLGKSMSGYAAERYIDIRSPIVISIIKARIKMCADKGFDAIEPDIDESYMSNTGFPLTKAIEEEYMTTLTNYAHSLGVAMWGKNPDDTEDSYAADMVNVFDAILTESCNQYNTCAYLDAYTGKKPVFNAEYKVNPNTFCAADAKRVGWSGVKFPLSLNGNRTTCF